MVLPGDHRRRPAGPLGDLCAIERRDHIAWSSDPASRHGGGPEPQPAIEAGARAATGELRVAGVERVVLREELLAERIVDGLVVVEAAVETLAVGGRHQVEEVLVHVRADELPAAAREAGVVQLLEERRHPGRHDRVEDDVGAARR